jgi:hypothetical protein
MAETGIVNETLFEKILFCPKCNTPSNVYVRFKCTQCGSINISMNRMIEHLHCGTIHQESAFRIGRGMTCPTCKKLIVKPEEYRLVGMVCSCNDCSAHFEDPTQTFYCRSCQVDFALPTANIVYVYTYTMNGNLLGEIRAQLGIPAIARILVGAGLEATSPGFLPAGPKESQFSIVARRDSNIIAIDVSQSDSEVEVEPVLDLYVKLLEVKPTIAVFGAMPGLSSRAKGIASTHNILVAEGSTPEEIGQHILEILRKV